MKILFHIFLLHWLDFRLACSMPLYVLSDQKTNKKYKKKVLKKQIQLKKVNLLKKYKKTEVTQKSKIY